MAEFTAVVLAFLWPAVGIQFVCTVVVLPLALFRWGRHFVGRVLRFFSFLLGVTAWLWGFLVTYLLWGWLAVAIGLLIFGVGVIPMAMVASGFEGWWSTVGQMLATMVLVYGTRVVGGLLIERAT